MGTGKIDRVKFVSNMQNGWMQGLAVNHFNLRDVLTFSLRLSYASLGPGHQDKVRPFQSGRLVELSGGYKQLLFCLQCRREQECVKSPSGASLVHSA